MNSFSTNTTKGPVAAIAGALKKALVAPGLIRSADDHVLLKQVEKTHATGATQPLEIRPLFLLVDNILARARHTIKSVPGADEESNTSKEMKPTIGTHFFDSNPDLPLLIELVSCEMVYKCLGGSKVHEAAFSVLKLLARYTWDAKLVITLAAFAVNYGDFLLLSQAYFTDPLGQSLAPFKPLFSVTEQSEASMAQFDAISKIVTAMIEVSKLMVEFSQFPKELRSPEEPVAVYWTVEAAVAAATLIALIATHGDEYMPNRELEPSRYSTNLMIVRNNLEKIKSYVLQKQMEKREKEEYQKIRTTVYDIVHLDNQPVLEALLYAIDGTPSLYHCSTKTRVQLDVLRGKTVLLLITGLDIVDNEISMLKKIYNESGTRAYEIVWVPVLEWNDSLQGKFESAQGDMPCYSVYHPSMISIAAIKFIKWDWNFKGKPILVALDDKGSIISENAFHMMWIWKNDIFPLSRMREAALWKQETWKLQLLVDTIDQRIMNWIKEDRYIIVYGGDDIEWIRKFTKKANDVAEDAKINLEMIYVGKSCMKKKVDNITTIMEQENLGNYLKEAIDIWFFWTRIESMLHSKIQLDEVDYDSDELTREIMKLLNYGKKVGAWAVLSMGSEIVISGDGTTFDEVLNMYEQWKERAKEVGFHVAMTENITKLPKPDGCCRIELSAMAGKAPDKMKCPECDKYMEKPTTFVCCHEEASSNN